jgi:hypothetical protein
MARFTTAGGSGDGTPGAPGADGADGADALWNFTGEYNGGASYAIGDIATYDGQLWYRANANGGNVGDTPSPGLWNLLAAKGADGTNGSSGLVYLGNYVSGNGYVTDLAVVRGSDNNLYIAKANGGLADPVGNTAEWDIFSTNTGGGTANIADFVFTNVDETNSSITVTGNKELTIQSGSSEDLNVRAGDDLWLTADDNIVVQADDELNLRSHDSTSIITNYVDLENAEHEWLFGSQGYLTLPGGAQIVSQPNSSGDGSGFSTLELVPDGTLETNQYLIIDPTAPNHIHIRAGGEQDASAADLFIGGERNNVYVSDGGRNVSINTKPATVINTYTNDNPISNTYFITSNSANVYIGDTLFYPGGDIVTIDSITQDSPSAGLITITANLNETPASFVAGQAHVFSHEESWNNYWQFGADGVLAGPAMGGLRVHGIEGYSESGNPLWVYSSDSVVINGGSDGEFLNDPTVPANQIATLADVAKTSGSWTVTTGTNTYNFTLPSEGTYTMWVKGNIPNGIILWNATVSVSNSNVPAIGSQYAWNYTNGGSPILLTAIPNQIRGVAGTINTDTTYMGNTSNRFDFTIANTSGASVTVYYGYTKI